MRLRQGRNSLGVKSSMCKGREMSTDGVLTNRREEYRVRGDEVVRGEAGGVECDQAVPCLWNLHKELC